MSNVRTTNAASGLTRPPKLVLTVVTLAVAILALGGGWRLWGGLANHKDLQTPSTPTQPQLTPPATRELEVGDEWAKVVLPQWVSFDLATDRPVVIRLTSGDLFEQDEKGKRYRLKETSEGSFERNEEVKRFGDLLGGLLYFRAKEAGGTKAKVTLWWQPYKPQ